MTTDPRPSASPPFVPGAPRPDARPAQGFNVFLPMLMAIGIMLMFIVLHYFLDQAQHRLIKILIGMTAISAVLFKPLIGLFLLPIGAPFLEWMPKIPVPGFNSLNAFLLALFTPYALGRVFSRQPIFPRMRLAAPIGIFILAMFLAWIRGGAFPSGYRYEMGPTGLALFRLCVGFLPYFISVAIARGRLARRGMVWALVLGVVAEGIATILLGANAKEGRSEGSMGQANDLGAFLATYTVFALAFLPAAGNFGRIVLAAAVVLGSYGVLLSVSRGAMVALTVGFLIVAVRSARFLLVILALVLVTSPVWVPEHVKERVLSTQVEDEASDDAELEASAMQRVETWRAITKIITDHPLDGVGFGGLQFVLEDIGARLGLGQVKDSAHNTFLRIIGELGLFGLLLFLFLIWRMWRLAEDGVRLAEDKFDKQIGIGLGSALVTLCVACMFGDRFFRVDIIAGMWIACALVDNMVRERTDALAAAAPVAAPAAGGAGHRRGHAKGAGWRR